MRPDDVTAQVACGADVEKIKPFVDAGFSHVALVQIGGDHQLPFIDWAHDTLLPRLREL